MDYSTRSLRDRVCRDRTGGWCWFRRWGRLFSTVVVFCSVTPVRRREDTEGNRDASVKVQLGQWYGSFLEGLSKRRNRKATRKDCCLKKVKKGGKIKDLSEDRLMECEMDER